MEGTLAVFYGFFHWTIYWDFNSRLPVLAFLSVAGGLINTGHGPITVAR